VSALYVRRGLAERSGAIATAGCWTPRALGGHSRVGSLRHNRRVSAVERFLAAASSRDVDAMAAVMAEDVRLHTPTGSRPIDGRERVRVVFGGFTEVLADVEYKRVLAGDTGDSGSATLASHAIFFSSTVAEEEIDGVILLEVDTREEIRAVTVFVRPLPGLQAFAMAMRGRLAPSGRSAD